MINTVQTESNYLEVDYDPFADGEILNYAPATESQKEIWASAQIADDANRAFNFSFYLEMKGNLNLDLFKQALHSVIQRHETLRITFSKDGSTIFIAPSLKLEIPVINLSNLTSQEQANQIEEYQKIASTKLFNLEKGPLFRAEILKLETQKYLGIFTAHYIICDGWSWWLLLTELGKIYSALKQEIEPDLEDTESFAEYALEEQEKSLQTERKITEEFWLKQFSDPIPILDFPTDNPRPPFRTFNSTRGDRVLSQTPIEKLKILGIKQGSSFMATLLAAFEVFLYRITGLTEVTVGVPTSGQAFSGKYNLMGHCVNLLPIRASVSGKQTFSNYVKIRKSAILDAYDHQDLNFGSLLQKLAIKRDQSRIPLVPILFNVQDIESEVFSFDGLEVNGAFSTRYFDPFEIVINGVIFGKKVMLQCQYNTNLFSAQTFQSRLAEFEQLLISIVENPDLPIDQLSLLPESEKR